MRDGCGLPADGELVGAVDGEYVVGVTDGLEGEYVGATDGPDGVYVGEVDGELVAFTITVPDEKADPPK